LNIPFLGVEQLNSSISLLITTGLYKYEIQPSDTII
jgi:hypothetical protein